MAAFVVGVRLPRDKGPTTVKTVCSEFKRIYSSPVIATTQDPTNRVLIPNASAMWVCCLSALTNVKV